MNTADGIVESVKSSVPFDEPGTVKLRLSTYQEHTLLTRGLDTEICFAGADGVGQTLRGSDVVAALLNAEGPVSVILWLPEGDGPCVKAKFTTGDT